MFYGKRFCIIQNLKKLWVDGGFATTDLHNIGLFFIPNHRVHHFFYFIQSSVPSVSWGRTSITSRAGEVASIGDFNNRQTRMLLVVWTQTAIIRAAVMRFCIEGIGHFRRLVVVSDVFVIFGIVGNQDLAVAVLGAALQHKNIVFLKNYFGVNSL